MPFTPILKTGRNCWRIRHAEKVAFLIDGDAYFNALYNALNGAQRDIMVLSWDIYSDLRPGALQGDSRPLSKLFDDLLDDKPALHARILNWDFAVLFAMAREWLPAYRLGWSTHRRLEFKMDNKHPMGASHHQKVVVIDRCLAFSGGLDITRGRWDTPDHKANDGRRKQVDGTLGRPYHDVQIAVSGDAAAALHDLARERWRRATGEHLKVAEQVDYTHWPEGLPVDLEHVDIAISRTLPAFEDYQEEREVEQLHLDVIAAAEDYIYIENQYFTSPLISEALAARLEEENGPQVVINLPLETEGWLAQNSMDIIRVKLLKDLRQADRHSRLAVYYPYKNDLKTLPINLHAKIMISDDRFARVGSSNLNNRSMGLDTECDIAIECRPDDPRITRGLSGFRDRLLAEHLHTNPEQVRSAVEQQGGLIQAIESLRNSDRRTLMPLEDELPAYSESVLTESELVDPEQPINVDSMLYHVIPEESPKKPARHIMMWLAGLVVLAGLAVAWRYTPLAEWLNLNQVTALIENLRTSPLAPLLLLAGFVIAGLAMVPVTLMIIASVIVFGPFEGSAYALVGSVACAMAGYGLGAMIGRDAIRGLAGGRIHRISQQLARRGLLTIIIVRIVPVAPFTIINMVAGASHIKMRDFFVGSVLGLIPGTFAIGLLTDRVRATLRDPQPETLMWLAAVAVLILGGGYALTRYILQLRAT